MEDTSFQTLAELSAWQSQNNGNSIAFIFESQELTFKQFDLHSNQIANGLLEETIKPQSRIAILGKDSDFSYEILFACAKAKAVLVPINWRLAAQEILYILNDGQVEMLFVSSDFFSTIEHIQRELSSIKKIITLNESHTEWQSFLAWREKQNNSSPSLVYSPNDVVVQMYTSGTTGNPKGVQLANYSFFRLMQGMKSQGDLWMSLNPEDTLLLGLPQFHIGGLWWAMQGFIAGAKNIIVDMFVAWKVLKLIEQHQITKVAMVPAMIQFVLSEPACKTTDFSSVKGLLYGGSPISPTLMRVALKTFDCNFFQAYGMTETGNIAVCLRPEDHSLGGNKRMKSAGKPLPGVEAHIVDRQNNILPANETGEICLKSPSTMLGYWSNESETNKVLIDGWMRTGDVGYIDDEGYIFVCDRTKDMIIYAGENIFPAEVEAALSEHEAIAEVAVIGVPDNNWGEAVKAFVVLHPETVVKKRELINFSRQQIADFKAPKTIEFVDSLPRNPSGKVLKRVLREPYWEGKERQVS